MAQFYSPNRRVTTLQTINVTVTDLDPFGQGVARHQGKTVFVPGVLLEEQAEIRLTEDKRQYARGELKRLLTRSALSLVARILACAAAASSSMPMLRCNSAVNRPRCKS